MNQNTNITDENIMAFDLLKSGMCDNFALFSCFVNGEPSAAIVYITPQDDGNYTITPLFVAVTPNMRLEDHDGVAA